MILKTLKEFFTAFIPIVYAYGDEESFNYVVFFILVLIVIPQCYTLVKSLQTQPRFDFGKPELNKVNSEIANSNLIVGFNTTMAKMQEMEKTLLTSIENKKNIYGSEQLLATIKKLRTIDTSTDKGKRAIIYLFNNGKFRTQKQLKEFLELMEQERYIEEGQFAKEEAEILAKRLAETQDANALMLNSPLCPFATPIALAIEVLTATFALLGGVYSGLCDSNYVAHIYNKINLIYIGLFFLFLIIDYFIFGGLHLIREIETEQELKEVYQKAGLKKPSNKMLMLQCGLYGVGLHSLASLAKSLKKK